MAVTHDATSSGSLAAAGTSITVAHTVANQPNRVLLVFLAVRGVTVSGITFNGVAMTQIVAGAQGGARLEIWRLVNPAATTANIVASFDSSVAALVGVSAYNVHQSVPESDTASNGAGSTTPSLASIDIVAGEIAYSATGYADAETVALTEDTDWTAVAAVESTSGTNDRGIGVRRLATAGAQTRDDTLSGTTSWRLSSVTLNEVGSALLAQQQQH